jgi:hypothetical protein
MAVALFILPFSMLRGGLQHNIHNFLHNLGLHQSIPTNGNASVLGFIQSITLLIKGTSLSQSNLSSGLSGYFLLIFSFGIIITLLKIYKHALWQSYTLYTLLMILLLPISGFYELLFLLPAIPSFINNSPTTKLSSWIAVSFAIVIIPKSYYFFVTGVGTGELLQAPAELLLLFLILRSLKRHELS